MTKPASVYYEDGKWKARVLGNAYLYVPWDTRNTIDAVGVEAYLREWDGVWHVYSWDTWDRAMFTLNRYLSVIWIAPRRVNVKP